MTAVILTILTVTIHNPVTAVLTIVLWGVAFRRYAGNAGACHESGPVRFRSRLYGNPLCGQSRKCRWGLYRRVGHYPSKLNGPALAGAGLVGLAFILGATCYMYERKAVTVNA